MTNSATRTKGKIHYAWWILIAASIVVAIGKGVLMNTAGLFLQPVADDLQVGMGDLTLYFSVSAIVVLIFLPLGGKLMAKYDPRQIIVAAIIFQAGSFALFGLMSSVWGWYLLAIPLAMGGTLTGVIVGPVLINMWFRKRTGLALGVLAASGGLVGAIAQKVVASIIAGPGWRTAYISVGLASIAIVIPIALVLLKRSPQSIGLLPYGLDETQTAGAAAAQKPQTREDGVEIGVARKSTPFYLLLGIFFLITSISTFSQQISNHVANLGFDLKFRGDIMFIYMIGVLIASLLLGYLVDVLGTKRTAILTMTLGLAAVLLIIFAGKNALPLQIGVALFGTVGASLTIVCPALVTALFGKRDYAQVYSNASLGLGISSIVAMPAYGYMYDAFGSYIAVLWLLVGLLIVTIACIIAAFVGSKKIMTNGQWITETALGETTEAVSA